MQRMRSIRTKLIFAFCAVFLIMIGVVWFVYNFVFSYYLGREAQKNVELLIGQTNKVVQSSFSMLENSVNYFFMDQTLQEWIAMDSSQENEELLGKFNMDKAIRHSMRMNSAWDNALMGTAYFYVDQYAFTFYSNGKFPIYDMTKQTRVIFNQMELSDTDDLQLFPAQDDTRTFFIGKSYVDEELKEKNLSMVIAVDEEKLAEEYGALGRYENALACIVDEKGRIYSASRSKLLGRKLDPEILDKIPGDDLTDAVIDGTDCYVSKKEVSQTGLSLIACIPKSSYSAAMTQTVRQYVMIVCIAFAALMFAGIFVIYKATDFLTVIEKNFTAVKNGNYRVKLPDFNTSELHELSRAFNGMTERIDYLIHEVYEKQIEIKNAELGFLQSQINPHFLFNTFAAIGTKAKLAGQEEIYRMIRAISTLLRASFRQDDSGTVEIREELNYVECYLYIQKERFGNKLSYEIRVEDETIIECRIPGLCIEPIVENAVIHGIEPKVGNGIVHVDIMKDTDNINIVVTDNGAGFRDQTAAEHSGSSIGMKNVDKRLKLMYGEAYGVYIDHDYREGARVIIKIPNTGGGAGVQSNDRGR